MRQQKCDQFQTHYFIKDVKYTTEIKRFSYSKYNKQKKKKTIEQRN